MLHCPGVSSWLLPRCACSEWQTFNWRGWSTWDLQSGTFSALWSQVTSCWNLSSLRGYIHTGVQDFCLWVQQHRSAKGIRTSSSRALAEGRPRAEKKDTHYTPLPRKYNFSRKVKVFVEAWLQAAWLDVLLCLLLSVLDFNCFGSPALKFFSFVLMCKLLQIRDVVCSRLKTTLNLQCDKYGTRKELPEEKCFTSVTFIIIINLMSKMVKKISKVFWGSARNHLKTPVLEGENVYAWRTPFKV